MKKPKEKDYDIYIEYADDIAKYEEQNELYNKIIR